MSVHKNLSDSQRHEPKGASTAASGEVWVADGTGSGSFDNILATVKNRNYVTLNVRIPDVSAADSVWVVNPILGNIYKIYVTIDAAITTADSTVIAKINGVTVTGSTVTVAYTASAPGSTFSSSPSGANTVAAGGVIEIVTDGASSTTSEGTVTILMDVS